MQPVSELLFSLRNEHKSIPEVPVDLAPVDMQAGYAAQVELCDALCAAKGGQQVHICVQHSFITSLLL